MSLVLIMGPMKSGKSLDLISRAEPYKYAGKKVVYIKPRRDVRTDTIASRLGLETEAVSLDRLSQAPEADVYAVDEVHMFASEQAKIVSKWLKESKEVIASGLNTDHAGRLMPTVARLLELSPDELINKQAICEACKGKATHTQVMSADGQVIPHFFPPEVPDDGTYKYEARCRDCFKRGVPMVND